ncbi:MAG: metal ABC transporter ATP-binding protein [Acidobacteria bacterium]|jgi:ABC-type Mn2+/Zn2+ transport system ATPase subunit|nr:metal ABC transporter ATP-binding protein [Acidobacteriota bacterium]
MDPLLEVKGLSVRFAGIPALENVSFTIEKEAIIAVIGPNGSGKTTLLKAILGLVPYEGEIRLFARPVRQVLPQVGYVPQRFAFDPSFPLTVEEFINLTCRTPEKLPVHGALDEVGMGEFKGKLIGELSGGQLQRVLLAHALLHRPRILFLDEATSGIDIEGQGDFYSTIQRLNREHGVTVLMVSHEISMVYKFTDRIICLNRDLVSHGETRSALTAEVLRKLYGENADFKAHGHEAVPQRPGAGHGERHG